MPPKTTIPVEIRSPTCSSLHPLLSRTCNLPSSPQTSQVRIVEPVFPLRDSGRGANALRKMEKVSESGGAWCHTALCEEVTNNKCPQKPLQRFEGLVKVKSIWRSFWVLLLSHHALGQLSVFMSKNWPGGVRCWSRTRHTLYRPRDIDCSWGHCIAGGPHKNPTILYPPLETQASTPKLMVGTHTTLFC